MRLDNEHTVKQTYMVVLQQPQRLLENLIDQLRSLCAGLAQLHQG